MNDLTRSSSSSPSAGPRALSSVVAAVPHSFGALAEGALSIEAVVAELRELASWEPAEAQNCKRWQMAREIARERASFDHWWLLVNGRAGELLGLAWRLGALVRLPGSVRLKLRVLAGCTDLSTAGRWFGHIARVLDGLQRAGALPPLAHRFLDIDQEAPVPDGDRPPARVVESAARRTDETRGGSLERVDQAAALKSSTRRGPHQTTDDRRRQIHLAQSAIEATADLIETLAAPVVALPSHEPELWG